jgi:hypothetical protein
MRAILSSSRAIRSERCWISARSSTPGSSASFQSAPPGKAPCMLCVFCANPCWGGFILGQARSGIILIMDKLRTLVLSVANADRVGGRATIVDGQTLILYDCMHWGCHSTDQVLSHFPEVQVSARACRQSLSGFCMVFHRRVSTGREMVWYLVIGLGIACCSYILFRPPWWSSRMLGI